MTRRIAFMTVALLVIATPALAKGVDGVTVTAGDQQVVLEWAPTDGSAAGLESLVKATYLYDVDWWNGDPGQPPPGDLGPVVVAEWNFPDPVDSVIVHHLYPLAENGPVGHVVPGQVYFDEPITGAWHPLRPEIVDVLESLGLDLSRLDAGSNTAGLLFGGLALVASAIIAGRLRQVA